MSQDTDNKGKTSRKANRGLGKGLSALMADVSPALTENPSAENSPSDAQADPISDRLATPGADEGLNSNANTAISAARYIAIAALERNPAQPRRYFDPSKLEDLTRSVAEKGILQPILARPLKGETERYQIVAGERRWQAAMKAGLDQMPVMVRELSDRDVLEIGVVENVQRANLNPIEEARAYRALADDFGRRQEDIAQAIGKSRSHVANMMRLLTLPNRAQDLLAQGKLSAGHARAIISAPAPEAIAELIVSKTLSVREAEAMVRRARKGETLRPPAKTKDADTRALEKRLSDALGLNVELAHKDPGGKLSISYKTEGQLNALIERLPKLFDS